MNPVYSCFQFYAIEKCIPQKKVKLNIRKQSFTKGWSEGTDIGNHYIIYMARRCEGKLRQTVSRIINSDYYNFKKIKSFRLKGKRT